MDVAFVVPRYGAEVAGGAEALCRGTARALADAGDRVTVYTTTARDYPGWEDHFPAGEQDDGGVRVMRFPAERPDPARAAALLRGLSVGAGGADEEAAWSRAQGPVSRPLLAALAEAPRRHEAVAVWTYLYATSHLGMPLVADRAVLVPMAHDEPMLRFGVTRGLARLAAGFAFLTPEERRLVDESHGVDGRPEAVVGAGLEPAPDGDAGRAHRAGGLPRRFALYLGRVDAAKGIDALVRAHARYRAAGGPLGLVLAGRAVGGLRLPGWVVDHRVRVAGAARRPAGGERGGRAALAAREPVAGGARGLDGRAADARDGALGGAGRPDGALGGRAALHRRRVIRAPALAAGERPGAARAARRRRPALRRAARLVGLRAALACAAGAGAPAAGTLNRTALPGPSATA